MLLRSLSGHVLDRPGSCIYISRMKTLIAKCVTEILIKCKCGLWKTLQLVNIEVTIETNHGRSSQSYHTHTRTPARPKR